MRVLKHERSVAFDVDETLVTWKGTSYTPNKKNINSLIRHAKRGHFVTVWSAGGWAWSLKVIRELGLEGYVDEVRTKFSWYCDDKPFDEFCERYWYSDDGKSQGVHGEGQGLLDGTQGITPIHHSSLKSSFTLYPTPTKKD